MQKLYRLTKNLLFSLIGKKTIGARALVLKDNQVLLVKHSYQEMWYTVGGGVDKGETPSDAIVRELYEEVGAVLNSKPQLFSVYHSRAEKRDDYIIFYITHPSHFVETHSPEIADKKWFPLDQLPPDVSPATQRRINEFLKLAEIRDTW